MISRKKRMFVVHYTVLTILHFSIYLPCLDLVFRDVGDIQRFCTDKY